MSSFRTMALASITIGVGVAIMGPIFPASAEPMMWWELGVTPSYGYGDDNPQRPREVRGAHARWVHHHDYRVGALKPRQ
jgi:hypothetical protein